MSFPRRRESMLPHEEAHESPVLGVKIEPMGTTCLPLRFFKSELSQDGLAFLAHDEVEEFLSHVLVF